MAKWVKSDSQFATGSGGRVTRAVTTDTSKAAKKATTEQKKSNPTGTKGGYGKTKR